jgi:replicative DNA helicase
MLRTLDTSTNPLLSIERNLLFTLMHSSDAAWDRVGNLLSKEHWTTDNGKIYDVIGGLINALRPTSINAVALVLSRSPETRKLAEGFEVSMREAVVGDARGLAKLIQEDYILRRLRTLGAQLLQVTDPAYGAEQALFDAANEIQRLQDELACSGNAKGVDILVVELLDDIQQAAEVLELKITEDKKAMTAGITQIPSFIDNLRSQFLPGRVIGLCGEDSTGKTTLAAQIFAEAVKKSEPALFVSMEMPEKDIVAKLVASTGNIRLNALANGGLNDDEWPDLTNAIDAIRVGLAHVDDAPVQTLAGLAATFARIKRRYGTLSLVVIDHLTKIQLQPGETLKSVAIGLQALARRHGCCVLLISHEEAPVRVCADVIHTLSIHNNGLRKLNSTKGRRGESSELILKFDGALAKFEDQSMT